jgi:hypothetical protein
MKVRKKPVEVEAFQLTENNAAFLSDWCKGLLISNSFGSCIQILTLEGAMTARQGDYIIKGVQGEFYPCAPAIFEKTYEIIEE